MNVAHDPTHSWGNQVLTDEQLKKLATNRLLGLYRHIRHVYFVNGTEFSLPFKENVAYGLRIKAELATRPHVKRHDTVRKKFKNGHKQKLVKVKYTR